LKMVLTGYEEHSVSQRCAIAGELLDALSTVPSTYIQSCSTAMVSDHALRRDEQQLVHRTKFNLE
jgi:hypothetical protein